MISKVKAGGCAACAALAAAILEHFFGIRPVYLVIGVVTVCFLNIMELWERVIDLEFK